MIQLDAVTKEYRSTGHVVAALSRVDLSVEKGQFVTVRGPSGSGKTTMLMMIGGMLRPTQGKVRVVGEDVYALPSGKRAAFRGRRIGFVFQTFHLVPYLNVLENVRLAAPDRANDAADAKEILEKIGLSARLTHRPSQLSAGEQQRAAIARAMLNRPSLILADEPGGNLDEENAEQVYRILKDYCTDGGTVIVVTHGRSAEPFADRSIGLCEGRLTASEPT